MATCFREKPVHTLEQFTHGRVARLLQTEDTWTRRVVDRGEQARPSPFSNQSWKLLRLRGRELAIGSALQQVVWQCLFGKLINLTLLLQLLHSVLLISSDF